MMGAYSNNPMFMYPPNQNFYGYQGNNGYNGGNYYNNNGYNQGQVRYNGGKNNYNNYNNNEANITDPLRGLIE